MTRSTKELLLVSTGTAVLLVIVWLLPEMWLKSFITTFFIIAAWLMWRMDK